MFLCRIEENYPIIITKYSPLTIPLLWLKKESHRHLTWIYASNYGKKIMKKSEYSRTSMARTPMVRLPWLIRTHFLSPYEILPIAQENKYLRKFSYFIVKLYVECTHYNCLVEAILMSTLNIKSLCRKSKRIP